MTDRQTCCRGVVSHLEDARMEALSPPKQESATASGMVQFITPNTLSAKVWREKWKSNATKKKEMLI